MVRLLWSVVGLLLALWSAVVWLGHLLLTALLGAAGELPVPVVTLPEDWARWLPVEWAESMPRLLAAAGPVVQGVIDSLPALAAGVTVLAWASWAVVAGLLLLAAGASHAGLRRWQRHPQPAASRTALIPS